MSSPDRPPPRHVSVMPAEVLAYLDPRPGQVVVDATVGAGGHARLIAERLTPGGRLLGLDQDAGMLALARGRLEGLPVTLVQRNFEDLREVLRAEGLGAVDGVVADLGVCSDQLDEAGRGFSFGAGGPLDMRMNRDLGETAGDLVNRLGERDLADLIYQYGEERHSRRVARNIVAARRQKPLETTDELAALVRRSVPRGKGRIDPATRVFQALRVAVNDELGVLERLLAQLPWCVKPGGRVVLISFHSLEDRPVKRALRDPAVWEVLTRKVVTAADAEAEANPRARSAKLRAARRLGPVAGEAVLQG